MSSSRRNKPFFLYVPFNAVHTPLQVPDSYEAPYSNLKPKRRTMAGMLAAMDEAVGQIVSAVESQGLRERTLFVFSTDNGGFSPGTVTDNGPLRAGKGTLYEGGVRGCAFATWDGHIPASSRIAEPLHMVDWYPTLLTLAGVALEQPRPLDGKDIWPVLTAGAKSPHAEILCNSTPAGGALRMGEWKLQVTHAVGRRARASKREEVELYNLSDDLGESRNVAAEHPEVAARLLARYEELASEAVPPKTTEGEGGRQQQNSNE
ncbi:MAG: sulfatase-like hydrolase/transferase [Planctomycetaceae bacterium]